MSKGWLGCDFDGTLAKTMDWKGHHDGRAGEPIWPMVERVQQWLRDGYEVRIMTARAGSPVHEAAIEAFCIEHFGHVLPITNTKDFDMIELWDDRAVQVEPNTGEPTAFWTSRIK